MHRHQALIVAIAALLVLTAVVLWAPRAPSGSPAIVRGASSAVGPHPAAAPSAAPPAPGARPSLPLLPHPGLANGVTEITPSGAVSNASAPISVNGNTYTLTAGFTGALLVERNGSTINGAGKNLNKSSAASEAIEVFNAQSVTVENFNITNASDGILGLQTSGLVLTGNTVYSSAIGLEVSLSTNATVTNNVAKNLGDGLYLDYVVEAVVSGNSFQGSGSTAISAEYSQQLLVQNNNGSNSFTGFDGYSLGTATISSNSLMYCNYGVDIYQASNLVISYDNVSGSVLGIFLEYTNNTRGSFDQGSGNGVGQTGLEIYHASNTAFTHLRLVGWIYEGTYAEYSTNFSLTNSFLANDDYAFETYYAYQVVFTGNNVSLAYSALYVDYGAHALLSNNSLSAAPSSSATGIYTYAMDQVAVLNNSAPGFAYGYDDGYSSQLTVRNNNFAHEHYGRYAMYFSHEAGLTVVDNNAYNASGYGLYVEVAQSVVLAGNVLSYAGNNGLFVYECQLVTVTGNAIDHSNNYSVHVEYSSDVTIQNNNAGQTLASSAYALCLYYNTNVGVMNNTFSHTNYSIYLVGDVGDQIVGNNASFAHEGLYLGYLSNVTVAGNQFWSDRYAFELRAGANLLLYHNNFVADAGWIIWNQTLSANLRWDNGYPSGGNFWGNWTSPDAQGGPGQDVPGADGIVDHAFVINRSLSDHYPLAQPWVVHAIAFTESGLAAGTAWQVTVNGMTLASTSATISYPEPDGATSPFNYTVGRVSGYAAPTPASGSGTMARANQSVAIAFAPFTYTVTVTETGLKSGTSWSVTLGGKTLSGTTASIAFTEPNGSYAYTALPVAGYVSPNANGTTTVRSASGTVSVTYVALQSSGATPGGSTSGYSATVVYALVGLVVVLGILAALGFLLGRRRQPPTSTAPWMPPSGATPPPSPPAGPSTAPPGATGGTAPPPPGAV